MVKRIAIAFLFAGMVVNAADPPMTLVIDSGSASDSGFIGGTALAILNPPAGLDDNTTRYGDFRYPSIPCAPGPHFIEFRFVETAVNAKGQRVFSIRVNQQLVFDQLDLFATGGRTPFSRTVIAYCSDGIFNIQFATIVRSASVSSIRITPMQLTTITYIKPQDPKTARVTEAVPVWFPNEGYFVPRPAIEPDPTVPLLYQDVAVYRNGIRQRGANQSAGSADFTLTSVIGQLKIMPASGQQWPTTDTITVDYTAVWPLVAPPSFPVVAERAICKSGLVLAGPIGPGVPPGAMWPGLRKVTSDIPADIPVGGYSVQACDGLEYYRFTLADGTTTGPYVSVRMPDDYLPDPALWVRQ